MIRQKDNPIKANALFFFNLEKGSRIFSFFVGVGKELPIIFFEVRGKCPIGKKRNKKNGKPQTTLKATHSSKSVDILYQRRNDAKAFKANAFTGKTASSLNETNLGLFCYFIPGS